MKYNKIMTVLLGLTLILTIGMGGVLAGIFPNPFVLNGNDDVNIIYGSNAASSDIAGANSIGNNLIATWNTQQPQIIGEDDKTTIIIGDESYLIQSHGNDLNFLELLSDVENKLTDDELPVLLADGEVREHDGEEVDYTQELYLGNNYITFGSLDSEDYIVNEDLASNEIPMLYMDLSSSAWELQIDFEKSISAVKDELHDNAKIIIAGKEYSIAPNLDANDDLLLYESAQEITIGLQETKVVTINGKEISITVSGADPDYREVLLIINGEYETVKEGNIISVSGERFYVNNIYIQTIPSNVVSVELFVGANEVEISASDTYQSLKLNGKRLDGVEARLNTNSINSFSEIWFKFTPSEMDEDDFEEGLEFLELGESIIDPLFGTIAMTFESADTGLDDEDRDFVELKSRSDELQMTFTNVDGDEIIFTPYEEIGGSLVYSPDLKIGALTDLKEDEEFILQISGDITDIFRIEDIDTSPLEVEIYSYGEDKFEIYEVGDTIDGTGVQITAISSNKVSLNGIGDNLIITKNQMRITLGAVNNISKAIITFDETNMDNDELPITFANVEVTIGLDNSDDIEITQVVSANIIRASDDDNDYEYSVTEGFGTYFVRNDDTDRLLEVYIPETEMDLNVYISAGVEKVIVTTDDDGNETVVDTTPSLTLGDIVFTDSSADLSNDNIIVVGGTCINQIAAELLGSSTPVCGADFTALSGVGEGEYGIFAFVNPYNTEKIAILVAGYDAEDTTRGINALLADNFVLPAVGEKFIV